MSCLLFQINAEYLKPAYTRVTLSEVTMSQIMIIRLLKTSIVFGLCLIVTGHSLIVSSYFTVNHGIKGIITAAACIAIGCYYHFPLKYI